jgi:hypothetical protein
MKYIILSLSLMLIIGCNLAQHGALINAYKAIDNNDCGKAYRELSNAEKYKKPTLELQAEISYLRSICLEKEKKYDEALALLFYIAKEFPNTEYGYRATFRIERIKSLSRENEKERDLPEKPETSM